ncbi:hypothetical protein NMG29_38440 [Streptomyces cocklensis]|jgi:hypothetical protein|uniref:Uncharacterized protein n=1 Tax=Actinacidiphila cocklensis TaxID=887465 RepID=A0A9W4GTD5_9ACTN|nr:hypothetical protein [Actinacidiphila cocklensis]MDD1063980.1 hypothetical protein [Actinacidiphila cocklensis]WSX78665.1 hypothetical protein OH826_35370 [Streptomyces sp. NBC_00899]CAG6396911.1 conserved hypothetical protein [Actinacidiphila cocklensis]
MGSSYEGVLVAAGVDQVRAALIRAEVTAIVAPVGLERTALLPREGAYNVADVDDLGCYLSGTCGFSVLAHSLYDSDLLSLYVYRGGECVHEYQSEMAYLGTPFEDDDGEMKVELGGVLYDPDDESLPSGPCGADPEAFASFGTGDVDLDRLGALLRGEGLDKDEQMFAESRHWAVAQALNLQPAPLTEAYRHAKVSDYPGAVLVGPSRD